MLRRNSKQSGVGGVNPGMGKEITVGKIYMPAM